jgi:hypothetical protein
VEVVVEPGHDLEHGGLAGAVLAHDADLRAGIEAQVDVLEHLLLAVVLVQGSSLVAVRYIFPKFGEHQCMKRPACTQSTSPSSLSICVLALGTSSGISKRHSFFHSAMSVVVSDIVYGDVSVRNFRSTGSDAGHSFSYRTTE